MDFEALVGRAAQYSSDIILIADKKSEECEALNILYGNPAFWREIGCSAQNVAQCGCHIKLSQPDFSNHALLSVSDGCQVCTTFRVSLTALPEEETGQTNCYMLVGRPSGASLSEGREQLYSDIARKFIERPADEAASAAVRAAGLYFDVEAAYAARLDLTSKVMDFRYHWTKMEPASQTQQVPQKQTICDWVLKQLQKNEVVQINDLASLPKEDLHLCTTLSESGTKACIMVPVLLSKKTIWFIGIHCMSTTRHWNKEDVDTFKVVGDLLGNAFTQNEIAWSLKESERRFSDVSANIPGVVYQMRRNKDGQNYLSYISQGVRELTGWGPASMLSKPELLEEMVLRQDRGRFREAIDKAGLDFASWSSDVRLQHRDGTTIKWVRSSGRTHRGSNGDTVWNGLLLDISDHHHAEETMRVSEERLRRILGTSPISIGISDVKTFKILFANKRLAEMFHLTRNDVIGFDTRKFYSNAKYHRQHWVETRRGKTLDNVEIECLRSDGTPFWAQITTRQIEYGGREAILWWAFDITDHKKSREALAHLAHHDSLTGLANRRLFDEHLRNAIALAKRNEAPGVLFYFDLDGFKPVNDQHGHTFGDWVLHQVGLRLRTVLRDTDIGARLGGDEFGVIAHGMDDIRAIEAVVHKMQEAISQPYVQEDKVAHIGLSIGVVRFFGTEDDTRKIVMLADSAMYKAKQAGKGSYRLINMPSCDVQKALS
ncbi:putative Diguanylate cyclase [Candidatus Terasakiella magnetica]|uniref:Putative Diguanylate cyclase n=1 Tax=Candidatus Terasakiella magnetica TaxID=1867952 RepID=A0A1C3RGV6_9PROT|nr:diguanylate cyclase [Candidatus Terasakiella magnetica]SCA56495.1 putative Diguanylate cyclase [Candidatus Terasakiella magnetica]